MFGWRGMNGNGLRLLLLRLDLLLLQLGPKLHDVLVPLSEQGTRLLVTLAEVGLAWDEALVALTQLCVQLPTQINRRPLEDSHSFQMLMLCIHFRNRVGKVLSLGPSFSRGYIKSNCNEFWGSSRAQVCDYPLIGWGVSSMCFFLVPQDFLRVQVESFQLLDQLALLGCVSCTLPVESLRLCTVSSTFAHGQNRLYEFIRRIVSYETYFPRVKITAS